MTDDDRLPLAFERIAPDEQHAQSRAFLTRMRSRRTVRDFSPEPVPFELIENAIAAAATAPSGANQQPWTFVVVSNPEIKRKIREAAASETLAALATSFNRGTCDDDIPMEFN